jgi:hypothetical protein
MAHLHFRRRELLLERGYVLLRRGMGIEDGDQ